MGALALRLSAWNTEAPFFRRPPHLPGASALSPKITLQLLFPDRPAQTVTLGPGRAMVGRESGDILLDDPEASALHAEIEFTKGAVIVRDLGSRNGTWREGQRLPQFALYRGQTFRCGTTDITLVEIEGAVAPVAGGTAAGRERVAAQLGGSSSTQPSSQDAAQTLASGLAPSSTGTSPGTIPGTTPQAAVAEPEEHTLVGQPPPPTGPGAMPTPARPATPLTFDTEPALGPVVSGSTAPGIPIPAPGVPTPVPAAASAPLGVPSPVPSAASAPLGVPEPVVPAPSAPLAPVANAVIKLGDARPKAAKAHSPVDRAARMQLVKRVVLGTLVVALAGGLMFGLYSLLAGRNQAFLREAARELPQDAVGVLALSSPRAVLELFGSEIPPEIREEATKDLGLDPFDPATFEAWGFDVDAPMGVGLLDGEGMFTVSVGVKDPDVLRTALSSKAAALIKASEDLRWIERSFADTPGLWLDEPISVAALRPGNRVIFVLGGDAEAVARQAKRVAEAKGGESLADRPGFGEIEPEPGKLLLGLYLDGASGRAALPGKGMEAMASRMALADIDGFAVMLADDGPRVHLSVQTILREGMTSLEPFQTVRRKGDILDKIPAPVLAELDGIIATESMSAFLSSGPLRWGMASALEDEFRKETGLDLRTDLIDNLDGRMGWVLHKLPGKDDHRDAFAMLGFAGVKDEEAAKRTAERFFGKMQRELDLALEQVEGTTVYVRREDPAVSYFIYDGVAWVTLGKVDVGELIRPTAEPFRRVARVPAIEEATAPGGLAAGFVDIREVLAQVRTRLDDRELEDLERWSPLLSPLEALTMRSELADRTFVARWTLHTSGEHALAGFVQGFMKSVGAELAKKLLRERRRERCDALIDHILELMKAELKSQDFEEQLLDRRFELMDECRKPETTDTEIECMLGAKTLEALTRCEEPNAKANGSGAGITPAAVLEQPEPTPVPYVEDIWPNTSSAGTATGKPDPQVNYAVPLGDEPATRGPDDALVTVVMFGDFQCPHCKRVLSTLDQLLASDREVRLVFRHNPLSMHPEAEIAARAALAAGAQGQFWAMHDKLFDHQDALTEDNFRRWAGELGLDLVRFDRDYGDAATAARVQADIAAAKKVGATGTPAFFVNGRYLGGAQPLHAFVDMVAEEKGRAERFVDRRGNTRKRLYTDMIERFAPEVVTGALAPVPTPAGETRHTLDTSGLPRRGSAGFVRVEIVECADFDCPFCKRAETTLQTVLSDYDGKVALFWLHNPLSFHPEAEPAARAATAAGNQDKFWEMHDKLMEDSTRRSRLDYVAYARELGLDVARFERDLDDPATAETVKNQQKICTDNEATGTPTFFFNGRLLAGAQPYDKFKEVIDQELRGGI